MIAIIWGAARVETQASVSDSFHWWYERMFVLVTHLQLSSCSEGFRCGDVLRPWRKQKLHLALSMNSSAGPFENIALICNISEHLGNHGARQQLSGEQERGLGDAQTLCVQCSRSQRYVINYSSRRWSTWSKSNHTAPIRMLDPSPLWLKHFLS